MKKKYFQRIFSTAVITIIGISMFCGCTPMPDLQQGTLPTVTLESLEINLSEVFYPSGMTATADATAIFADNSTEILKGNLAWTSSDSSVAEIDESGKLTTIAPGEVTLTVTYLNISTQKNLTVVDAELSEIIIEPQSSSLPKGYRKQFTATAIFNSGTGNEFSRDVSSDVQWSSNSGAVTVSADGLVSTESVGSTEITAVMGGKTGRSDLEVTDAVLQSIEITPFDPVVHLGDSDEPMTATGLFSDGTVEDITTQVNWISSIESVVTVTPLGLITTHMTGESVIEAEKDGKKGISVITVSQAKLLFVKLETDQLNLALGLQEKLRVDGTWTDGTKDITSSVTWSSSNVSVAEVSNGEGTRGMVRAVAEGTAVIRAAVPGTEFFSEITVTVSSKSLMSIDVSPVDTSVPLGLTEDFTAEGTYSDGSVADITSDVTWTSENSGIAAVSNIEGNTGNTTTVSGGDVVISAAMEGVTGTSNLKVTSAELVSMEISPVSDAVNKGLTCFFGATGTFTDGTSRDISSFVVWSSSDSSIACISNASGANGLVYALEAGSVTITAAMSGISNTAELTVLPESLVSISIKPSPQCPFNNNAATYIGYYLWEQGNTEEINEDRFSAEGTYSDGSVREIAELVQWHSSNSGIVKVNSTGLVESVDSSSGWSSIAKITAEMDGVTSNYIEMKVW